jgi:hypothetical protein
METLAVSLGVSGISSNQSLVPDANIVIAGSGGNRTVTVTPVAGQTGTAVISLEVNDGTATTAGSFTLQVTPPNTAPSISNVTNRAIYQDSATGPIAFSVGDAEAAPGSLVVTGVSSNTALVPNANIVFGGADASRTVNITPASGQTGSATITLTVIDGALSTSDTFVLTVNALPTAQTITFQAGDGKLTDAQYADSWITQGSPSSNNGTATTLTLRDSTTNKNIGLVGFFGIFGSGANRIPVGSIVQSATLRMVNANDRGK